MRRRATIRVHSCVCEKLSSLTCFATALLAALASTGTSCTAQASSGRLQFADLGTCRLVSGQEIRNCRLGYRTWGRLNAQRSNAVLFPTWFSGRSADLAASVGAQGLVDPAKFFVIVIDALGDGVSSSPSNSTAQHGPAFPAITIQDMVNSEYRLATETLHLHHLHAVMGISMGGLQTFEWMVDYPNFMDEAIPIVGSPRPDSRDLMLYRTDLDAVTSDPAFDRGHYTQAPPVPEAELIWQLNLTTPANFARTHPLDKFPAEYARWRSLGILPFDANDWVAQLEACVHHDIAHGGSLQAAASRVKTRVLVVNSAQDHMVNPQPALAFARFIDAKTLILQGDCGHIATDCEAARLGAATRDFLETP